MMFKYKIFFLVLVFVLVSSASAQNSSPSGLEIMREQEQRDEGYHDQSSLGLMILVSKNGGETEREFESRVLEKQGAEGEKSVIRFIRPADIQGTGLLSLQNKDRDDDQWLYLPAMKKTKRISGAGKSGSFVGSEFSYEDLIPPDIDKYTYQYLQTESCPLPPAPSLKGRGEGGGCFVVESHPKTADSGYSKTILWIRTDNYQTVKADFYDKKERHQKSAEFEDLRLMNGKYWRPHRINIKNHLTGKSTRFVVKNLKISSGLSAADFTQRALER